MPIKPLKILGVNPGTRYLGYANLNNEELTDWGIKVVKGKWSRKKKEKVLEIIMKLIEYYEPNVVAIKKVHPSHGSRNLFRLTDDIVLIGKKKHLKIRYYSIRELKTFFCPGKKANRLILAQRLSSVYPALYHELKKETARERPYYLRMFEAVALGALCFYRVGR